MGVGLRLKEILREKNMTIKELANISGVSLNTLYSITKRDSERVDIVLIKKIADALNVKLSQFLPDELAAKYDSYENLAHELSSTYEMVAQETGDDHYSKSVSELQYLLLQVDAMTKVENEVLRILHTLNNNGRIEFIKRGRELTRLFEYTETPPEE